MSYRNIQLDPALQAALAQSKRLTEQFGPVSANLDDARRCAELVRGFWNEGGPALPVVEERSIPGLGRYVPVMLYSVMPLTHRLRPALVYLHGGGFKFGSHKSNDLQMRMIAQLWGGIVISADYQHMPEARFPVAVLETAKILTWLHDWGSSWGIDGEELAIGGSSAGASVVFGANVHLGHVPWIGACIGIVGAYSYDPSTESMQRYGQGELFPQLSSIQPSIEEYLPQIESRSDPRADLLKANPKIFAPTFIAAAEFDIFRDASSRMAERLHNVGKLAHMQIYEGMSHLFFGFSKSVRTAEQAVRDTADFLSCQMPFKA